MTNVDYEIYRVAMHDTNETLVGRHKLFKRFKRITKQLNRLYRHTPATIELFSQKRPDIGGLHKAAPMLFFLRGEVGNRESTLCLGDFPSNMSNTDIMNIFIKNFDKQLGLYIEGVLYV